MGLPADCGIADTDLCIVLGNLLENAPNACSRQASGERFLRVLAKAEGQDVFLSVENSCGVAQVSAGEGLGLPSVEAVAKKYSGYAKFKCKGGVFLAAVLMYREQL